MKTAINIFKPHCYYFSPRKLLGKFSLAVLGIELFFFTTAFAQSTAPLIQQSDIIYLGAFALPAGTTYGASNFNYGGKGITPYHDPVSGKMTLFLEGHGQNPGNVAQVEVPDTFVKSGNWDSLPRATVLQNFSDVTEGGLGNVDPTNQGNEFHLYGMLVYNNRLILGASNSYSFSQAVSHGVSSLTLSKTGDFKGWYSFASNVVATPRALGGPMTLIPPEWQSAFGGPALTGHCCISVISTTSQGPSVTVFNPDDVGVKNPIPGKTVLFYPTDGNISHLLADGSTQNDVYNLTSRVGGIAFPSGTRSVLFIEGHGIGPYCYGTAAECGNDTAMSDVKGPHAQPYRYQILAYDANDLLAVKNGTKQTWEPRPYGVWVLSDMPNSGTPNIAGAGYDPETGRLYITQDYGSKPRVEVYQITAPYTNRLIPPNAPTGLKIIP